MVLVDKWLQVLWETWLPKELGPICLKKISPNIIFFVMAFSKLSSMGSHSSKIMDVKKKMWARYFRLKSSFPNDFFKAFIHLLKKMRIWDNNWTMDIWAGVRRADYTCCIIILFFFKKKVVQRKICKTLVTIWVDFFKKLKK